MEAMIFADTGKRRLTSVGPVALTLINEEPIIRRQLSILRSYFPDVIAKLIIGYKSQKLTKKVTSYKDLAKYIYCVNKDYEHASPIHCVATYRGHGGLIIIPGSLVFSQNIFSIPFEDSGVIVTKKDSQRNNIGVSDVDGYVGQFSYEFLTKWTGLLYLDPSDANLFCRLTLEERYKNFLVFELLNAMINFHGSSIRIYRPHKAWSVDIEKPEQIKRVERLCLKS